ncbi:Cytidylate kinase [Coemansia spiralis]|nr:Cytidylate kinase [Coemansia spiralis]
MFCARVRVLCSTSKFWSLGRKQPAREFTIAIDGPAASGKSSTARAVAKELGFGYIDSGSIYRCATLLALRQGIAADKIDEHISELASLITAGRLVVPGVQVLLNSEDVSKEIRTPEVNRLVAKVASDRSVREAVLHMQRALAAAAESSSTTIRQKGKDIKVPGGVVMDGRDIGTTVFPTAELKIYLDASPMARAIRRWDELSNQADYPSVEDIARELEQRDYQDINREHSPLRIASDAVVIDNTNLTFEQQVYSIADLARERMGLERKHDD